MIVTVPGPTCLAHRTVRHAGLDPDHRGPRRRLGIGGKSQQANLVAVEAAVDEKRAQVSGLSHRHEFRDLEGHGFHRGSGHLAAQTLDLGIDQPGRRLLGRCDPGRAEADREPNRSRVTHHWAYRASRTCSPSPTGVCA
jgi:hypothetical protein